MAFSIFVANDDFFSVIVFLQDGRPVDYQAMRRAEVDQLAFFIDGFIRKLQILPQDVHIGNHGWLNVLRRALFRYGHNIPTSLTGSPLVRDIDMELASAYDRHYLERCAARLLAIEGSSTNEKRKGRTALALAAGFSLPSEDGFWQHPDLGPIHEDAIDAYLREKLLSALDKLGL